MGGSGRLLAIAASAALVVALAPTAWAATPGPAFSWGWNNVNRLGVGFASSLEPLPTPIAGPGQFTSISAGWRTGCALGGDDSAYCWGYGTRGQLGNGAADDTWTPVRVLGPASGFGAVAAGYDTTCALQKSTSVAYCWGEGSAGELGNGRNDDTNVPAAVSGGRSFRGIDVGQNSVCAVALDDSAYCWGQNSDGQLGDGTFTDDSMPSAVVDVTGSTFINRTTINGLGSDFVNDVYAIGSTVYAATSGGLSISTDGGSTFINRTTANGLGSDFVYSVYAIGSTVYAATNGGLAISTDGGSTFTNRTTTNGLGSNFVNDVYATGSTVYAATWGGLSISTKGFAEVSAGGQFACGVTKAVGMTGPGVCWGWNGEGQLGNGSTDDSSNIPVIVDDTAPGVLTLRSIAAGSNHACAISTDDSAYCWGDGTNGQLGNGSSGGGYRQTRPTRVLIPGDAPVRDISAGSASSCAVTDDTTYCWGWQAYGQLGNGLDDPVARALPIAVTLSGIGAANSPAQVTSGEFYNAFIVQPRMTFAGTAFPSVQVGQSTSTLVPVQNTRPWTITITGTSVTGAGVAVTGTTCNGALPSGATCTVSLAWAPPSAGTLNGTLTVSYVGNSSSTPLTGTASPPPPPIVSSPPRDVSASAGDSSASVTWTAPTSPGSYPVTTYQVTSSPGGQTCLTSALTCTVTGLANGTTYTFTVKALSGAGWGETSAPSNAVTPVAAPKASITITGSRDGQRITITGTATHLNSQTVRPWIRFPGETTFSQGSAVIAIAADGSFTWSRKSGKKIYVYIAHGTTRSNTVTIPAR